MGGILFLNAPMFIPTNRSIELSPQHVFKLAKFGLPPENGQLLIGIRVEVLISWFVVP